MHLTYIIEGTVVAIKRRVHSEYLIQVIKIQHNKAVVDWAAAIIKQNEIGNFYILISTETFLTSSFLDPTQTCFSIFSLY